MFTLIYLVKVNPRMSEVPKWIWSQYWGSQAKPNLQTPPYSFLWKLPHKKSINFVFTKYSFNKSYIQFSRIYLNYKRIQLKLNKWMHWDFEKDFILFWYFPYWNESNITRNLWTVFIVLVQDAIMQALFGIYLDYLVSKTLISSF